jgi:hypothetical protein
VAPRRARARTDLDPAAGGIGEVWFVDQVPGVLVCRRPSPGAAFVDHELGARDTLISPLLDGFSVAVDELFRR